jgi:hypothetical protein
MMMTDTSPRSFRSRTRSRISALLGAHRGQRLVQQQDLGVRVDRSGATRDGLALPAGELWHTSHGDVGQVDAHVLQVLGGPRRIARLLSSGQRTISRLRNMLW